MIWSISKRKDSKEDGHHSRRSELCWVLLSFGEIICMGNKAQIFESKSVASRLIQNFMTCKGGKNTECRKNGRLLPGFFLEVFEKGDDGRMNRRNYRSVSDDECQGETAFHFRKSAGFIMGMSRNGFSTSKSSSPVTMTLACPFTATSKMRLSRTSRQSWTA